MDIGAECLAEEGASKYNAAENAEVQCGTRSSHTPYVSEEIEDEVELQDYSNPVVDRVSKLEDNLTMEVWRQGALLQRVRENERVMKHMMGVVSNLQGTYVDHLKKANATGMSCYPNPTARLAMANATANSLANSMAMANSAAASHRRSRSPTPTSQQIAIANNQELNRSQRYSLGSEDRRNVAAEHRARTPSPQSSMSPPPPQPPKSQTITYLYPQSPPRE
ncbi:uncharacterized protein LOC113378429 [Ctenocephalides felis]|uniref:uncharacterized protein LOC113378429 n=1 Tax=Ctenocephalides felis TaxID=7515 RepID=UPI000E6E55E5|nr:uncharacterized protein LOC113378429 [Ctenocephalides felis]